jgi:5-methylcytosine-specific restriction endonuclease McrBC regulatory subunit McrC
LLPGFRRLATAGIDKQYQCFSEETSQLRRSHTEMMTSHSRLLHLSGKLERETDELTADTRANQVLPATCRRLLQSSRSG